MHVLWIFDCVVLRNFPIGCIYSSVNFFYLIATGTVEFFIAFGMHAWYTESYTRSHFETRVSEITDADAKRFTSEGFFLL